MWTVATTDVFDAWFQALGDEERAEIEAKVNLLEVFGPALGSSLLIARFGTYFRRETDPDTYRSRGLSEVRPESKPIGALAEPIRSHAIDAFRHAVNDSFRLATVFALLGIVIACFMRSAPLRSSVVTEPRDVR